jgi:hypothetical protein
VEPVHTLHDGPFDVSYGQGYLTSGEPPDDFEGDLDLSFAGQANGLLGTAYPAQVVFLTGLHTGLVDLRVELHDSEPALEAGWPDVVEASWVPPVAEEVALVPWADAPVVTWSMEPGAYRVRYCVVSMDADHEAEAADEFDPDAAVGRHLLQLWPAPSAPDVVVAQGSEQAAYWHGAWKARQR